MWLSLVLSGALAQEPDPWVDRTFVITASETSFAAAMAKAAELAEKTGIRFDMRGVGFDGTQRAVNGGLTFTPEACEDNGWGYPCYLPRGRWDEGTYVSVEYSSAIEGFAPGLYVVIAATGSKKDVKPVLKQVKTVVSDAYAKTAKVYMGCLH